MRVPDSKNSGEPLLFKGGDFEEQYHGRIAALLGISRQRLYDIFNEHKPVAPAVAVRLGKLFRRWRWGLDANAGRI